MDGLEVLKKVFVQKLPTKVILLTMHKEMTIFKRAAQYNVAGYLLKENSQDELEKCLDEVKNGRQYISKSLLSELTMDHKPDTLPELEKLTFAEKKVLELVAQQKTSKQIAELLFISEKTVEGHRANIIQKLNLPKEKNSLLIWAMKHFKTTTGYSS